MTTVKEEPVIDYADQTAMFDPGSFAETVTLIGLGGIGSATVASLVNVGFQRFELWDDDTIEPRNLASQGVYHSGHLYQSKAEVCREYLLRYGAVDVEIHQERLTAETPVDSSVVISGVDSMNARKEIWKAVKRSLSVQIYLDGRIGGTHYTLLAVDPLDSEWYEKKWLFDSNEVAPLPYGERAIAHTARALSADIAAHLVNWHGSGGEMPPRRIDRNMKDYTFLVTDPRPKYRDN